MHAKWWCLLLVILASTSARGQSPTPGPVPSYRIFQNSGTTTTQRATANFSGGLQTIDNVPQLRSDVSIATGGVTNAMLQHPSLTIATTGPLGGGAAVALGGTLTLTCTSCLTQAYTTIKNSAGTSQTQRSNLKFGADFTVADATPDTTVALAANSVTVSTTSPISGGGALALGGTLTIACPTCVTSLPTLFYQTVQSNSADQTQRGKLNFAPTFSTTDSAGSNHTTVDVATGGISNGMLANSAITINATSPLGGGAAPNLGGSMTLTCSSCITGAPSAAGDLIYSTSGGQGMTALADVVAGSYLRSGGVAVAPVWSTLTLPNAATTGDILYASSANTVDRLADVAINQALLSGGIGVAPSYGAVPNAALANDTIGVLAGTGLTGGGTPVLGSSATISMPSVGPGAGLIGGSGISSVTLDAQGRVTAAATATYLTSAFYQTIKNSAGTAQTQRANLKFGADFSVADATPDTTVALASNSLTVGTSAPLGGGGAVALGGTLTLTCTSCLTGTPTTTGDVMYSTAGAQAMTPLHPVAAGSYIRSAGTAAAPVWSTLTLPNAATTGDLLSASGANAIGVVAAVASGSYLRSAGTSTLPVWSTTTLPNSATTGDVLYASASNAYSNLADVAVGSFLRSGGTSTAPVWSTTTWPNAATLGDIMVATGANAIGSLADVAVNKVLLSGGIGALPTWGTVANAALTNSAVTVTAGTGLAGGGSVALGSSVSLNLPNVGPGAGTIGGGGTLIVSITLDAEGRVTAATTGTATGTGTVTSVATNNGLTGGTITASGTLSIGGTDPTTFSTGNMSWAGASTKTLSFVSTGLGSTITITAGAASTWDSNNGTVKLATIDTSSGTTLTTGGTMTELLLNNGTNNWIRWATTGIAAPAFTTRSLGTKLVLYPALDGTDVDYGAGVDTGTLWLSVPTTAQVLKLYGGITVLASLGQQTKFFGGLGANFRNVASTVTVTATDYYVGVSGTGARTVNLPAANTLNSGQMVIIQDTGGGTGTITINRASTDTINGATSVTVTGLAFGTKTFVSNGSNAWFASGATN